MPPSTAAPPAMPSPPAAIEPPPKNAKVAFVAATPLSVPIAVPPAVVPRAIAALYAPNAVSPPAIAPLAAPPTRLLAKPCICFNSSKDLASNFKFPLFMLVSKGKFFI